MASPKAHIEKKSAIQGMTTNEETRLQMDTTCIFFFISSLKFIYASTKYMGRVQEGGGYQKRLSATILMAIRKKLAQDFQTILVYKCEYIMKLCLLLMQVQYRNCNYIGEFNSQQYQRSGYGLLILDNSQVIMAKWKSDQINGPFALITDHIRALGTMTNNKLEGYNVISIQESLISNKKQDERTIYGMFRENKLYGKALIINGDQVIIAHYTDGKLRQISQRKPVRDKNVYQMLKVCFPNETYSLADWLTKIFSKAKKQFPNDGSFKYEPIHKPFQDNLQFFGFSQLFSKGKAVGFLMNQGDVLSIGQHQNDYLQGLGRCYYSDGTVQDGVFKQGQLCGIGISYSKKNHKYILGEHNQQNSSFQKGFGFPQKQINQIRKQFHLRSIYFYNDIVLLSCSTFLQAICSSCLQYSLQSQSPRFSNVNNQNIYYDQRHKGLPQKSPLKAKINQYDEQSDHIDDPSPIKNRPIDQYERIDHRRSKYFDNNQTFQEKERSNSRSRQQSPLSRNQYNDGNKSRGQSRKIKDTKALVRQLDEKERTKRGYLDQIYKQAKLYSKRSNI